MEKTTFSRSAAYVVISLAVLFGGYYLPLRRYTNGRMD